MNKKSLHNIIDGNCGNYQPYISKCTFCMHFESIHCTCIAFPDGIPIKFLSGKSEHLEIDRYQKTDITFSEQI